MDKHIAIVLAGGRGSRMNSSVPKQYIKILDKPVLYYSLKCFQDSFVNEIILVAPEADREFCKKEIVDAYGLTKISTIVSGGEERYHSVYNALCAVKEKYSRSGEEIYVYIHDGARPCIDESLLKRCHDTVREYQACIPAVAVKDTIKVADENGFVKETPSRNTLVTIQTPQAFSFNLIMESYNKMFQMMEDDSWGITDDAMVVENFSHTSIKLYQGDYNNTKITTPEDIFTAEKALKALKTGVL